VTVENTRKRPAVSIINAKLFKTIRGRAMSHYEPRTLSTEPTSNTFHHEIHQNMAL